MRQLLLLVMVVFWQFSSFAADKQRPKVGLVLSGGGARGFAHIAILEKLDEMKIPVDIVVGTSMGAVVGGLYASGYTGQEIREKLMAIDWESLFKDGGKRCDRYFRRKRDDDHFLVKGVIGLKHGGVILPAGIVEGQVFYQEYKKLTIQNEPLSSFSKLPIPFVAVATDITTGQSVILDKGDLALSMLASMSVPGIFPPVNLEGKLLVDGGVANNLPVEVAKRLGAERLIVVNVSTGLSKREQIQEIRSILTQITNIYSNENVAKSIALLNEEDVLIEPNLDVIDTSEFDKRCEAYLLGKEAANAATAKLEPFVRGFESTHFFHDNCTWLNGVYVDNNTCLCTQTYYDYLPITRGLHPTSEIDCPLRKLYGLELFEKIEYHKNEKGVLVVEPKVKSWGPTYLQGSFLLATDFAGASAFTLSLGITRTLLNKLDGEFRVIGSIGNKTGIFTEIYQPISSDLKWYVNPRLEYERQPFNYYIDNDDLARYRFDEASAVLGFGKIFGEWGRVEVGLEESLVDNRLLIGEQVIPEQNFKNGGFYGFFQIDTFDDTFFPHKGIRGKAEYDSNNHFDQVYFDLLVANSLCKHTLLLGAHYGTTLEGTPELNSYFLLGGLFRLSGLAENQLFGDEYALLQAIYYYRATEIKAIPNYPFPLYLGASIETGNTWQDNNALSSHSFRGAGSIFLGLDTILGPIYLGYGFSEGGRRAAYLFIGQGF